MTKRICVFCGSRPGADPAYLAAARAVGELIAARGVGLVYGAGGIGLMGEVARACVAAGGDVIGVIPRFMVGVELPMVDGVDVRLVDSMLERKQQMVALSDAFAVLPGGTGTLDEVFEVLTWAQLGLHTKPIGLLDVSGFWSPLVALADHLVAEGFVRTEHRALLVADVEAGRLLDRLLG